MIRGGGGGVSSFCMASEGMKGVKKEATDVSGGFSACVSLPGQEVPFSGRKQAILGGLSGERQLPTESGYHGKQCVCV